MFGRILVPLDGSERAEDALPVATRIARNSGSSLILLRAISPLREIAWPSFGIVRDAPAILAQECVEAGSYLENVANSDNLKGIVVHTEVIEGDPADAILSSAYKPDLIVICSHGTTGLTRWMQGSVSFKVSHYSPVPVLLLPPQEESQPAFMPGGKQIRVLVPLDGSSLSEEALPPAIALTRALSAPKPGALHLTSVATYLMAPFVNMDQDLLLRATREYLKSVEQRLLRNGEATHLTITSSVMTSTDIARALVEMAETGKGVAEGANVPGDDMIAMSTHGISRVARWMLGSITERVLYATKLPVLIVRPAKIRAQQQQEKEEDTSKTVSKPDGKIAHS
jgi:nucleotide-binding universal stress UspA family protein